MDLKAKLQAVAKEQNMTFKDLAAHAGMNENGLHDKFRRNSLTVKDLCKLLEALGLELAFVPLRKS